MVDSILLDSLGFAKEPSGLSIPKDSGRSTAAGRWSPASEPGRSATEASEPGRSGTGSGTEDSLFSDSLNLESVALILDRIKEYR